MNPYRLPQTVIPSRYDLRLEPDLAAARFTGEVRIAVEVLHPIVHILLNAAELVVHSAEVMGHASGPIPAAVALDEASERVSLELPALLGPGAYVVRLTFTGMLNDKLRGFYRSRYKGPDGEWRWLAATQFEATDARRCFPCWDEPAFKAVFASTLVDRPGAASGLQHAPLRRSRSRTAARSCASPTPCRCPRTWSPSSSAAWRHRARAGRLDDACASGPCRGSGT